MKPELVLGFDPAPVDLAQLIGLSDTVRTVIRGLVEARSGLDGLGRSGSVWDGPLGAPVAMVLRQYAVRLATLEEALVDCLQAVDVFRADSEERVSQVDDLVAAVADLAGVEATERRGRLIAAADEIRVEHDRATTELAHAFEELSAVAGALARAEDETAVDLDRALAALSLAVDEWLAAEAPELLRTALALGEVAGLTTVISELIGIAALGRRPGEADDVGELIARSPGSHRLVRALRRQWFELAPESLPAATFGGTGPGSLADAVAGRVSRTASGVGERSEQ